MRKPSGCRIVQGGNNLTHGIGRFYIIYMAWATPAANTDTTASINASTRPISANFIFHAK